MRSLLTALVTLAALGCAHPNPKPADAPARAAASTSERPLPLQAGEIKSVTFVSDTASTKCQKYDPGVLRYVGASTSQFSCVTSVRVGIHVDSKALNIDRLYEGNANFSITGYESTNALDKEPLDVGSAKEIAALQASNLNALTRRYSKLKDGCMGSAVELVLDGGNVDLKTGEYFGDQRCRAARFAHKATAGVVYLVEIPKEAAKTAMRGAPGVLAHAWNLAIVYDDEASKPFGTATTYAKEQSVEAYRRGADVVDKLSAPTRAFIASTFEYFKEKKQSTTEASYQALKNPTR